MSKMFKIDFGSVNNPIKLELKRKKLEKELTWELKFLYVESPVLEMRKSIAT